MIDSLTDLVIMYFLEMFKHMSSHVNNLTLTLWDCFLYHVKKRNKQMSDWPFLIDFFIGWFFDLIINLNLLKSFSFVGLRNIVSIIKIIELNVQ